jgi:hypothetical protein
MKPFFLVTFFLSAFVSIGPIFWRMGTQGSAVKRIILLTNASLTVACAAWVFTFLFSSIGYVFATKRLREFSKSSEFYYTPLLAVVVNCSVPLFFIFSEMGWSKHTVAVNVVSGIVWVVAFDFLVFRRRHAFRPKRIFGFYFLALASFGYLLETAIILPLAYSVMASMKLITYLGL